MDYADALTAIEALDGGAEIRDTVKAHTEKLLKQKHQAGRKIAAYYDAVQKITQALGIEFKPEVDDLSDILAKAVVTLEAIASEKVATNAKLEALTSRLEIETRNATLTTLATKLGCDKAVLNALIPAGTEVDISGDVAKIGGLSYDDWVDQPTIKPFASLLTPPSTGLTPPEANPVGSVQGGMTLAKLPTTGAAVPPNVKSMFADLVPPRAIPQSPHPRTPS